MFGATPETVGAGVGVTVKGMLLLSAVEPTLRTVKVTVPAVVGSKVAVSSLELTTVVASAEPPASTSASESKPEPVTVTLSDGLPATAVFGVSDVMRGPEPPPRTSGG